MFRQAVKLACHTWFGACLTWGLIIDWAGCVVITTILPDGQAQRRCCQWSHYVFRYFMLSSCPWIRVSRPPVEEVTRLLHRDRVCVLMNHTSFGDSIMFVATTPSNIIWRYRTLMKSTLFDWPFLGGVCRMVGHFPVLFRSKDEDSFAVDKPEQAKIMEKVKAHVESDGCLCLFPEGKINRNPAVLCPFRRGTFGVAEEMNMAVVSLTTVGCDESWPKESPVGGLPARIVIRLTEIAEAGHGLTAAALQEKAEASMQADVTSLLQERDA
ncbi:unnamed protein product [Ectocarpus sp. 12 AP-2014]